MCVCVCVCTCHSFYLLTISSLMYLFYSFHPHRLSIIAVAKTGSGKTLGFLLPVFHRISNSSSPSQQQSPGVEVAPLCIILSPTRELAIQIHGVSVKYASCYNKINCECVYGGTNVSLQCKQLKEAKPQILIATPGRLCDLLERNVLTLSCSSMCVLVSSTTDVRKYLFFYMYLDGCSYLI